MILRKEGRVFLVYRDHGVVECCKEGGQRGK